MIQLFIDGKPAVIKDDTSFKLSLENNFFTKTSSYSFDVELPMNAPENQAIFGNINRRDVTKEYQELPTRLLADNVTILSGTVTITQVTEDSVKVQLLGESAAYHFGNKMDKLYIDELPLGDWYNRTFPPYPAGTSTPDYTGSSYKMTSTFQSLIDNNHSQWLNLLFNNGMWVAYPIFNTEAETMCNHYLFREYGESYRLEMPYATPNSNTRNGKPQIKFAVQPFVWYMCEIIAEATGYKLSRDNNPLFQNEYYRRIFLANANINIECNKCLPHWTVNEWWEQIERTFGVTMVLSDSDNSLSLVGRDTYLSGNYVFVDNVVDEYSTDIEKEASQEDIVTQNVGFAENELFSLQEFIPDEIIKISKVRKFDSFADLRTYIQSNPDEFTNDQTIYEAEGRQYIPTNEFESLVEVNMFRPRIVTENDNIDIELKFVPCAYSDAEIKVVTNEIDNVGFKDTLKFSLSAKVLARPDKANIDWLTDEASLNVKANFKLNDLFFNEGEIPEKEDPQDIAYIAIHPDNYLEPINYINGWPRPWLHEICYWASNNNKWLSSAITDAPYSLSLIPIKGQINLASESINSTSIQIGATVKHCFKFIVDKIPNTSSVFVINGKKYLCEKLEVSINNKGIDKLITGYFFELS